MARKKLTTQELVNKFPEWSDVRRDEQSVGHSLINVMAGGLEDLQEELYRAYDNFHLTSANVGEIDQTYVFTLPVNFEFAVDDANQLVPLEIAPTVSGLYESTWYNLDIVEEGDLDAFWYDATPTRVSVNIATVSGINYNTPLLDTYASTASGVWSFDQSLEIENKLLIRITEGTDFFYEDRDVIRRAKVRITGTTWKDTTETEELVFLWNEDQYTTKTWKKITKVEAIDFLESARIQVFLLDAGTGSYFDPYQDQHQYLESRNTMARFWDVGTTASGYQTLVAQKYAATTVEGLLSNQSSKVTWRNWEFVDANDNPVNVLDIQPLPYSRKTWAVTASGLHLYDLDIDVPSVSLTKEKTSGGLVRIETSDDYPLRYEDVGVDFLFQRPIKTILRHRLRIMYPDGQSYGVLSDGTLVATSTDYWISELLDSRFIRATTFFQFTDFGNHIVTMEVEYVDGEIEYAQRVITVERKQPLVSFDLSSIPWALQAVGMDHVQNLYVVDVNGNAHLIEPHYDLVLVDYINREVICREPYEQVKVLK